MQISELASQSGVSVHAIRHYESQGLIAARRLPSGYRQFDESVIRELRFITMSRQCGFSLPQIAEVLPAYRRNALTAAQMIERLQERIAELDAEIARRNALRKHLVSHIAWFREREPKAQGKPGFPRAPARGDRQAGQTGPRRSKS